jgi:hypothetical protein
MRQRGVGGNGQKGNVCEGSGVVRIGCCRGDENKMGVGGTRKRWELGREAG